MQPRHLWALLWVCVGCPAFAGAPTGVLHANDHRDGDIAVGGAAHFALPLVGGGFARVLVQQTDLDLVVTANGPDGKQVMRADASGKGETEILEFPAPATGSYDITITPFDPKTSGRFTLRIDQLMDAASYAAVQREDAARQAQARAWVAAHAIPLAGTDPTLGIDDLKALAPLVGDARVVLLGEATHGTHEFFQLKHRMLEYLVQEKGFNVFAIEANLPEAFALNRYVVDGDGDPERALAGLYFWTWDTEEVFQMIHWMRSYNEDPAHTRKLKFYGFDMQFPQLAVRNVTAYLARVDGGLAAQTRTDLVGIADAYATENFQNAPAAERAKLVSVAQALLQRFDASKSAWSARTSADAWDIARQNAVVIDQFARMTASAAGQAQAEVRAKSMAENLQWIAAREGPDAKVVGWAHNGHVTMGSQSGFPDMGGHLKAAFGDRMRVFGFAFAEGSFQSVTFSESFWDLLEFHVQDPVANGLDAMLAGTGKPLFVVDLHALPAAGAVAAWFAQPRAMQGAGSMFNPASFTSRYDKGRVQDEFDALVFVERTSAARSMPMGHYPIPSQVHPLPSNLDFERGESGDLPSGWGQPMLDGAFGYHVAVSTDHPHGGHASGQIFRLPGPDYGLAYGELRQVFDATPYRSQRVRVHAWMRARSEGEGSRGHLTVWTRNGDGEVSAKPDAARDANYGNPVTSPQWEQRAIELDVPKDATRLSISAILVGGGSVWIDDVGIESLRASDPQAASP